MSEEKQRKSQDGPHPRKNATGGHSGSRPVKGKDSTDVHDALGKGHAKSIGARKK